MDPSRMFQLNWLEGTGPGEAGPTHNDTNNEENKDDSEQKNDGDNNKDTNAYAYGGTEGDRKGKRDALLGPQKIKSPQNAAPSDNEVTWGMFPPPGSKEEAKLDQEGGAASKQEPEEDGAASMGASWRAAEVWGIQPGPK